MDRWEAEIKYAAYRQVAREATYNAARGTLPENMISGLSLSEIDDPALDIFIATWDGEYDWQYLANRFRSDSHRLELAIWHDENLCGLTFGGISDGPENVTIRFLERRFWDCPLAGHVAEIATDFADNYAKVLGKQWVKLKEPTVQAVPIYTRLGFTNGKTLKSVRYMERAVK